MSDDTPVPAIEPLLVLDVETRLVCRVPRTPLGDRMMFDIAGGSFRGARLRGCVLASGGDWVTRTAAGSQLDVRLLLETDDGVTIPLRYSGRASERAGQPHIEIAGSFDAPEGAYDWLNHVQAFGLGSPTSGGVRYQLFRFG